MAKAEWVVRGNFDRISRDICDGVMKGSMSASLEDSAHWRTGDVECAVYVFERYSMFGNNRVSMNVTLFGDGHEVRVCGITSGGSQAVFFKLNTVGEETFLGTLKKVLDRYS